MSIIARIGSSIKSFYVGLKTVASEAGRILVTGLSGITYAVSRFTTGAVLMLGSFVGLYSPQGLQPHRLYIAGMTFMIGLPFGLIIFGNAFNIMIWLGICTGILFAMNLHNSWEVYKSLRAGALDIHMAQNALDSVQAVTPTEEDIRNLHDRFQYLQERIDINATIVLPGEKDYALFRPALASSKF